MSRRFASCCMAQMLTVVQWLVLWQYLSSMNLENSRSESDLLEVMRSFQGVNCYGVCKPLARSQDKVLQRKLPSNMLTYQPDWQKDCGRAAVSTPSCTQAMGQRQGCRRSLGDLHQHCPHNLHVSKRRMSTEKLMQLSSSPRYLLFTITVVLGMLIWGANSDAKVCAFGAATFPYSEWVLVFSLCIIKKCQEHFKSSEIECFYIFFFFFPFEKV